MRSYNIKKMIAYCIITSLVTIIIGFFFVEKVYLPNRRSISNWVFQNDSYIAREYAQHLKKRESGLSVQEHNEIVRLIDHLGIQTKVSFLGNKIVKIPSDLWMMHQIMFEKKPDYVIETGTYLGASALYWAFTLDVLGLKDSKVITIDIEDLTDEVSKHTLWQKYVIFIHASSTSLETVARIQDMVKGKKVLVVLDSDHHMQHVLDELRLYGPMVSPGSYIVVEDTFIEGVPARQGFGPGPMAAVIKYLEEEGGELFEQDVARESLIFTRNAGGWLRRKID